MPEAPRATAWESISTCQVRIDGFIHKENGMKINWTKIAAAAAAVLLIAGGSYWLYRQFTMGGKAALEETAAEQEKRNRINGQWSADGGQELVCDIWQDEEGVFHCSATLAEEADTISFWECSGIWSDAANGFDYSDGVRTRYEYNDSEDAKTEVIYEGGKGQFYLKGDYLFWKDKEEHIADDAKFTYIGEY